MESEDGGLSAFTDFVIRLRAPCRRERLNLRRDDQILEGEEPGIAGPRAGRDESASINARIVLRGRRSSFSTSRTPDWCMAADRLLLRPRYLLAVFSRSGSACWPRLGACAFQTAARALVRALSSRGSRERFHKIDDLRPPLSGASVS